VCVPAAAAGLAEARARRTPQRGFGTSRLLTYSCWLDERETIGEVADLEDALHRSGAGNDQQLNVQPVGASDERDHGLHAARADEAEPTEVNHKTFGQRCQRTAKRLTRRNVRRQVPLALESKRRRSAGLTHFDPQRAIDGVQDTRTHVPGHHHLPAARWCVVEGTIAPTEARDHRQASSLARLDSSDRTRHSKLSTPMSRVQT
jgi:hypothetical protein